MDNSNPANVPPISAKKRTTSSNTLADLNIGDPAPSLSISKWLRGKPLNTFARGQIYVVEFWASWFGPCQMSLPYLSELQNRFPDVVFLSVAIWEENEESPQEFLDQTDNVTHRVAIDRPLNDPHQVQGDNTPKNTGQMARDWMTASGEVELTTTFLVDGEGRIALIGSPNELEEVLPALIDGTLVVDKKAHNRKLALNRLKLDPTFEIDASIFADLFNREAPSIKDAKIDWLWFHPPVQEPEPKLESPVNKPDAKSSGLFGRLMGRSKEKEKEKEKINAGLLASVENVKGIDPKRFGPPALGKPYGLLLLPILGSDNFTPGWETIDDPALNTLPKVSTNVNFVAVMSGDVVFDELYDEQYRSELALWGVESGWRLGFEMQPNENSEHDNEEDLNEDFDEPFSDSPFTDEWLDTFSQQKPPVAAFVDGSGEILWFGSPLKLPEAVEAWSKGELTLERAENDLLFWYRLQASAEANERLAGVHETSMFEGVIGDGPNFENDPKLVDVWEETVESLKKQFPWRAGRWRIFEFRLAAARARHARHTADVTTKLVEQFRKLTDDLEEQIESSPTHIINWKSLIKEALDYLGLNAEPMQPLDTAGLLIVEGHPLTLAVLDSVARHDAAIPKPETQLVFEPSLSPIVLFKLDRIEEAVAAQEKMIESFDEFVECNRKVVESIHSRKNEYQNQNEEEDEDEDWDGDSEIDVDQMNEHVLRVMLGEPASSYRNNLVTLRDHYKKYLDRS